jgi:membrane associated rhomboid family serine protease
MKRLLWTAALAVGGFALGWQDQGGRLEPQHVLLVTVWFAAIGFGFGSIFSKRRPSNWLLVCYWAFTLGLVAVIFSGFVPLASFPAQAAVAGAIGGLLGGAVGFAQWKLSERRHNAERPVTG